MTQLLARVTAVRSRPLCFGRSPSRHQRQCGHDGALTLYVFSIAIGNGCNLMEGRAAVASAIARETATTERGPPGYGHRPVDR